MHLWKGPDRCGRAAHTYSDRRLRPLLLDPGLPAASVALGGPPGAALKTYRVLQSSLPAQRGGSRYTVVDESVGSTCSSALQSVEVPA